MTIGDRLLKLRRERNLSQEDLANELDVSRQTISKWETNQSMPDFDKIVPLCEYFGITTDELLTGSKDIIETKENNTKAKFAINLSISISLYILSIVAIILFSAYFDAPIIGVCLFFVIIAIATGLIIYSSIMYGKEKKKKENNSNPQLKMITDIVNIISLIIYLIVSFATFKWQVTWIIFLMAAAVNAIIKLIFSFSKKEVNENVECD